MVSTFIMAIHYSPGSFSSAIRKENKLKGQIGKEEVKLCLFADGMILWIGEPKGSIKKLLEILG